MRAQEVKKVAIRAREVCQETRGSPPEEIVEKLEKALRNLRGVTSKLPNGEALVNHAKALELIILNDYLEPARAEVTRKQKEKTS